MAPPEQQDRLFPPSARHRLPSAALESRGWVCSLALRSQHVTQGSPHQPRPLCRAQPGPPPRRTLTWGRSGLLVHLQWAMREFRKAKQQTWWPSGKLEMAFLMMTVAVTRSQEDSDVAYLESHTVGFAPNLRSRAGCAGAGGQAEPTPGPRCSSVGSWEGTALGLLPSPGCPHHAEASPGRARPALLAPPGAERWRT